MNHNYILSCESTVDMPYSWAVERDIKVLFYQLNFDGELVDDDMLRTEGFLDNFYEKLMAGKQISTSQLTKYTYEEYFTELLKEGKDILHIGFSSGLTPSVNNAKAVAEELNAAGNGNKIIVIDSLCASQGYGMLVDYAADMRDNGDSIDTVAEWVEANCQRIHHRFYSYDISYYRKSGRISGAAAAVAAILNICPMMYVNREGKLIAYNKVRGRKAAIRETVKFMSETADNRNKYSGKCIINHSQSLEAAEETKQALQEAFPNIKEFKIIDIGTIIASHTGPGTVSVFFHGDERAE